MYTDFYAVLVQHSSINKIFATNKASLNTHYIFDSITDKKGLLIFIFLFLLEKELLDEKDKF